jgi:hypothetical protein
VWLAALVGLLIGGGLSVALLRERLIHALRNLWPGRLPLTRRSEAVDPQAERVASKRTLSMESTMVVEEHAADELQPASVMHALATRASTPIAEPDPESDLTELFEGIDGDESLMEQTGPVVRTDGAALDLDLSGSSSDATVDQEVAWVRDEAALGPSQEFDIGASIGSGTGQIDLHSLTQRATDDAEISRTLEDALNLLESDYEDEFTASQAIDRAKLQQALDEDALARTGTGRRRS